MKTTTYHVSNMGRFNSGLQSDSMGYVTIHDSERYALASDEQLEHWCESRIRAVRNAARTEINNRQLTDWQASN